jgi:membrane protein YqaA with SNARE-associated domain
MIVAFVSLFFVSFLASTLIPMPSEAVLAGLLLSGFDPVWLLVVASCGNTLGATFNWLLGRFGMEWLGKRWPAFETKQIDRASSQFRRLGAISLLFSWVPIIGDPLTFAAGVLGMRFVPFVLLVGIGKVLRYVAVLVITGSLT